MDHDTSSPFCQQVAEKEQNSSTKQRICMERMPTSIPIPRCVMSTPPGLRGEWTPASPPCLQGENEGPVASDQLRPTPSCPQLLLPGCNVFVSAFPHLPRKDGAPRGTSFQGGGRYGGMEAMGDKAMGGSKPQGDRNHRQTSMDRSLPHPPGQPKSTTHSNLKEAPW